MVDFNEQPNESQDPGGSGGSSIRAQGRADTKLLERALRERWPIPEQFKDGIINRQVRIAIDPSSSPRESTSAARCLVSMEAQNQADQLKVIDKNLPDLLDVSGVIEQRLTVEEMLTAPEYIEWLRERERDSKPGVICENGHAGNGSPLANGDARDGH